MNTVHINYSNTPHATRSPFIGKGTMILSRFRRGDADAATHKAAMEAILRAYDGDASLAHGPMQMLFGLLVLAVGRYHQEASYILAATFHFLGSNGLLLNL